LPLTCAEEKDQRKRKPFSREWIVGKLLAPGALANLNEEARAAKSSLKSCASSMAR
jgi:hypothetical protein